MIEVAILDAVETLIGKQAPFALSGVSSSILFSGDSTVAGSLAAVLASFKSGRMVFPQRPDDWSKVWLSGQGASPFKAILFDVNAETVAFDDSGARGLAQIVADNAGTVWANAYVAGSYGLWKRTGAGTWTQALSDSALASTGIRYRPSDSTLWFQSSTGNHYQLANGVATLTTAPTGTLVGLSSGAIYVPYFDAPYASYGTPTFPTVAFTNADGTANSGIPTPYEFWQNRAQVSGGGYTPWQVHIDATYSLISVSGNGGVAGASSANFFLYILNRVTGVWKYIGSLPSPSIKTVNPGDGAVNLLRPILAKWSGAGLRIYLAGEIVEATQGGILKVDVPYQPNF